MKQEYIGITGIKTINEAQEIASFYESLGEKNEHRLMLGVLASTKRMSLPFDAGKRSPAVYLIPQLLEGMRALKKDFLLPMLHYHPTNGKTVESELQELFNFRAIYAEGLCRAVQINTAWPEEKQLEHLKGQFQNLEVVLQLPNVVLGGIANEKIAAKAKNYSGLIDHILLDCSGGKGIDFNPSDYVNTMNSLKSVLPTTPIGFAGGLGPNNIFLKTSVLKQSTECDFSIDAEGRLMQPDNFGERLNMDACTIISKDGTRRFTAKLF